MAVVMTLAIGALIGAMALSTDVGLLYYNWGLLQKAADSAVLAGANYLPSDPAGAILSANSFASQNGIQPSEVSSTVVADGFWTKADLCTDQYLAACTAAGI